MNRKMMIATSTTAVSLLVLGLAVGNAFKPLLGVEATNYTFTYGETVHLRAYNDATSTLFYGTSTIASGKMTVTSDSTAATSFSLAFASDYSFTIADGTNYLTGATASTTFKFGTTAFSWEIASETGKNTTFLGIAPKGFTVAYAISLDSSKTPPVMISKAASGNNFGTGKTYKIAYLLTGAEFSSWILADTNFDGIACAEKAYRAKCMHQLVNTDSTNITADAAARYTNWCAAAGITV